MVDAGRLAERAVPDRIDLDLGDVGFANSRAARSAVGTARLMILK